MPAAERRTQTPSPFTTPPMSTSPAIATHHLTKTFGHKTAVADLTLAVERGEVFGFLGPNGAGKTTAVKMLLGLIAPTSGTGRLLDAPLGDPQGRHRVGFLPEHFRFHHWLRAHEFLAFHADLYQVPREVARKRVPELLELVGLTAHAEKKLRAFSKGMLQRIGLAQALLNEPELVVLDEPTSGLDPVGRRLVRDVIRRLRADGTTVFLNSHLLGEVEVTCDRVAFIKEGHVVQTQSVESLVEGQITVEIRAQAPMDAAPSDWEATLNGLEAFGTDVRISGDRVTLTVATLDVLPAVNRYLVQNSADVYALTPQRYSLEDLFIRIVGSESAVSGGSHRRIR